MFSFDVYDTPGLVQADIRELLWLLVIAASQKDYAIEELRVSFRDRRMKVVD